MQPKKNTQMGRPRRDEDYDNPADIPLNQTEKLFVHQYLLDSSNLAEVMRKIGSDAKDLTKAGSKILNRPNVRKAISEGQKEYIVQAAVTKAEITVMLRRNWEEALAKGDVKAANEAAKLLGQACPDMFHAPQKVEVATSEPKAIAGSVVTTKEQKETLEAFSGGSDELDIDMDIDRFLRVSRSSDLGSDEFDK